MNLVVRRRPAAVLAASPRSAFAADQVNLNTADAATLDRVLSNVGPPKAAIVVDYRKEHGAFRSAEELAMVKGIGLQTAEKRDRISLPRRVFAALAAKPRWRSADRTLERLWP